MVSEIHLETSQGYAQKTQRICPFMNSASGIIKFIIEKNVLRMS